MGFDNYRALISPRVAVLFFAPVMTIWASLWSVLHIPTVFGHTVQLLIAWGIGIVSVLFLIRVFIWLANRYPLESALGLPLKSGRDRGQVQLVDVMLGFYVLVAIMALAPFFYHFIGMVTGVADPFSSILLQLTIPLLLIALILSVGVSGRRGGG